MCRMPRILQKIICSFAFRGLIFFVKFNYLVKANILSVIVTVAEDENVPFWLSKSDVKLEDF